MLRRGKLTRNNSNNTASRSNSSQSAKDMGITAALLKEIGNSEVFDILLLFYEIV